MTAEPFANLSDELDRLDPSEQDALMGRCNWILFSSGLAKWSDIVTRGRIREYYEVMDILGLSLAQMIEAGVPETDARHAWNLVHTPEREAIDAERRKLFDELKAIGISTEVIIDGVVENLSKKINRK